jgi:hypothetical protein
MRMRLYHFTSRENLRAIQQSGLSLGTVHVSQRERLNAVWLTADPGPNGHGLESGGAFMSELDRQEAQEWTGVRPPAGARFPKMADVRVSVELEPGDRNLQDWLPWARRHLSAEWMAHLHPVASGNLKKAKTWRLYFGIIPPNRFAAIEELEQSPSVVPLRPQVRIAS